MVKFDPPILDFSDKSRIVESIRELFVLVVGACFGLLYMYSLFRLYFLNKRKILHIETIALFTSSLEIIAILLYEFVMPFRNADFTILTIQILVLSFFFYKMLKTFLETSSHDSRFRYSRYLIVSSHACLSSSQVFYVLAASAVIAIWIVVLHRGHSFCCSSKRYSASWFVLVGLYALVCTLNMVMGTLIVRNRLSRLLGNYEIS